jgi:hypothetical protein
MNGRHQASMMGWEVVQLKGNKLFCIMKYCNKELLSCPLVVEDSDEFGGLFYILYCYWEEGEQNG